MSIEKHREQRKSGLQPTHLFRPLTANTGRLGERNKIVSGNHTSDGNRYQSGDLPGIPLRTLHRARVALPLAHLYNLENPSQDPALCSALLPAPKKP